MPQKPDKLPASAAKAIGQSCVCFNLRKTNRVISQFYDEHLRPSGLRATQFNLLVGIKICSPVNIRDLAEAIMMERSTLTRNLKPLERKGLVRVEAGQDPRQRKITLTRKGQKALAKAAPLWEQAQEAIGRALGPRRLSRMLADLNETAACVRKK